MSVPRRRIVISPQSGFLGENLYPFPKIEHQAESQTCTWCVTTCHRDRNSLWKGSSQTCARPRHPLGIYDPFVCKAISLETFISHSSGHNGYIFSQENPKTALNYNMINNPVFTYVAGYFEEEFRVKVAKYLPLLPWGIRERNLYSFHPTPATRKIRK